MKMKTNPNRSWLGHVLVYLCGFLSSKHRNGNGIFFAPSISESLMNGSVWYIVLLRPINYCHGLITNCYHVIASAIFGLISFGYPLAVFFGIAFVVVLSFDRVSGRALTHVFKKAFECFPLFRVSNSAASPVFEISNVWVAASGFHLRPGCVGVGVSTRGVSVGFVDFRDCLTSHASAGFGMAGCHFVAVDRFSFSARTSAYPVMFFGCVSLNNSQPIESLTYRDLIHSVVNYQQA